MHYSVFNKKPLIVLGTVLALTSPLALSSGTTQPDPNANRHNPSNGNETAGLVWCEMPDPGKGLCIPEDESCRQAYIVELLPAKQCHELDGKVLGKRP